MNADERRSVMLGEEVAAMTEAEWLATTDPTPMLEFLRGNASERKLRLFMIACARLLWERIPPGEMREAVEAAERGADGVPWEDELKGYCDQLYRLPVDSGRSTGTNWFKDQSPEKLGVYFTVLKTTGAGCGVLTVIPMLARSMGGPHILPLIGPRMPDLLRDIFGNPYRPLTLDPAWLIPPAVDLSHTMYQSRDFSKMLDLAQSLQDAGCESADVLDHCRGPGPHARGCWVVDLLLGKK
jgi:hypothetical protein